jgi:hypothetical protein
MRINKQIFATPGGREKRNKQTRSALNNPLGREKAFNPLCDFALKSRNALRLGQVFQYFKYFFVIQFLSIPVHLQF